MTGRLDFAREPATKERTHADHLRIVRRNSLRGSGMAVPFEIQAGFRGIRSRQPGKRLVAVAKVAIDGVRNEGLPPRLTTTTRSGSAGNGRRNEKFTRLNID